MRERECTRCGLRDANVLDLDIGSSCHPELRHCIAALRTELAAERKERGTLQSLFDIMTTDANTQTARAKAAEERAERMEGLCDVAVSYYDADMAYHIAYSDGDDEAIQLAENHREECRIELTTVAYAYSALTKEPTA